MNNNIANIVNDISLKYNLLNQETNALITKYQNDTRPLEDISKEINEYASYYRYQHMLNQSINNSRELQLNENYYVMTFDNNSNIMLEAVNINTVNPETQEVIVNNTFKGYQKHTPVDDLEISLCQIGKLLNFDIVEEYRIYNKNKEKDSVIIKDIVNNNEFYNVENLRKRFQKLISNGKIKKEKWVDFYENLNVANSKTDYEATIDYGLKILKILPSMLEDDYKTIEKKYLEMILFDCLINQSERKFEDYGILCNKETRRYTYAPLFDNVFPSILQNNDTIIFNNIKCNRNELLRTLIIKYYDKISDKIESIIENKEKIIRNMDVIFKYNLDVSTYTTYPKNIKNNINLLEELVKEKKQLKENENAGFADIATISILIGIIVFFSLGIAYLLYCIK